MNEELMVLFVCLIILGISLALYWWAIPTDD